MSRTYAVSGSASGIGRATTLRLERDGHRVVGIDLRDAEVVADLATPDGRAAMVAGVRAAVPTLDGVIACAGVELADPLTVRVNFFGAVAMLEGLRELLAAGESPRAVAVASLASIHAAAADEAIVEACLAGDEDAAVAAATATLAAERPRSIYASSKRALCRWVRRQAPSPGWAGAGIPLNAVAPGIVRTPMTTPRLDDPAAARQLERWVPMPLGGPGSPDDLAALLTWLAGEENVLLCGQVVFADGGADAVLRGDATW